MSGIQIKVSNMKPEVVRTSAANTVKKFYTKTQAAAKSYQVLPFVDINFTYIECEYAFDINQAQDVLKALRAMIDQIDSAADSVNIDIQSNR